MEPFSVLNKVKLVRFKVKFSEKEDRHQIIPKVTNLNQKQKEYFKAVGIKNPMNIENFLCDVHSLNMKLKFNFSFKICGLGIFL